MTAAYFVTGTDTEVGKTTIAAGLLHAARLAWLSTAAAKPVASGCEITANGLRNSDALVLLGECTLPLPGCMAVSATGGKRSWCASVWHWPREVWYRRWLPVSIMTKRCRADTWAREPLLTVVGRARGAT